jgi:hypothetical protein
MRTPHLLLKSFLLLLLGVLGAQAASISFWQVTTQADFLEGDGEAIAIDADGRVTLGPALSPLSDPDAPALWRAVAHAGFLFVGSGVDGKVFRVGPDGKAEVFFDADELQVHALAAGPGRDLYVGTSPDGKIYRVDPQGKGTVVFDPEEKYIWALQPMPDGGVLVATGEPGSVHRVAPDGKTTQIYRAKASHVTCLLPEPSGTVLAGTDSPGQVLRLDARGKAFVLLDTVLHEIRALVPHPDGGVLVAAMTGRSAAEPRTSLPAPAGEPQPTGAAPVPTVTTEVVITAIGDTATATPAARAAEAKRETKGAVFRIAPDGLWEEIWSSDDDVPYDVDADKDAVLLVTGPKGKVFRLPKGAPRVALVARVPAMQVTDIARGPDGERWLVTANPGRVFRLSARPAARGTYESDVLDATTTASWGSLRWNANTPAGTSIEFQTRSGNSDRPDETWSDWSEPLRAPAGSAISSPKARYLQWRATLAGPPGVSPVLTSVIAAYLPRNVRPRITSITVHPPGTVFLRPYSSGEFEIAGFDAGTSDGKNLTAIAAAAPAQTQPALGRRSAQKGLQTFVWKAEDANDDKLQYDVFYRRDGDTQWKPLRSGLWDALLTWDTTFVPDGVYAIRVVASDAPANDAARAMTGEAESVSFLVDNTAPGIDVEPASTTAGRLRFTVQDATSPILRVEYSFDSQRWQTLFPSDGLNDSRREQYDVQLEGPPGREVTIRAFDALNNVVTAPATVPAAAPRR